MEYGIGILIGVAFTILAGGIAVYLVFADKSPAVPVPPSPPPSGTTPAITVFLIESFLNQQLDDVMLAEAVTPQPVGPFTIQLNSVHLELAPESRALLTTSLTVTAVGFPVRIKPVTEIAFYVEKGRARILVSSIHLEGIRIPRKWVDGYVQSYIADAEEKLNQNLVPLHASTGVTLSAVETSGDILTLTFVQVQSN